MKATQVFKKCQMFSGLNETQLDRLAAITEEKEYIAGTVFFREGSPADEFFVIEDGKVALQMTLPEMAGRPARRITVDIVAANEVIGWSAIVEPYIYTLTAICLQKTKAWSINGLNLRRLLNEDQQISHGLNKGLVRVIADRLSVTRHVMISERLLSPPDKVESLR